MTAGMPEFVSTTVKKFTDIHRTDSHSSYVQLISAFVTCLSILAPEDRYRCVKCLNMLIEDMDMERFEDGLDFISFIKEKGRDRLKDMDNDKDADSE